MLMSGCLVYLNATNLFNTYFVLLLDADLKIFIVLCCFLFIFEGIIPITTIILKFAVAIRLYMKFHLSKKTQPIGFL